MEKIPDYVGIVQKMSAEERKMMLRKLFGPPTRELEGDELNQTWLVLQFLEPFDTTNNQQWYSEKYMYHEQEYHVHYVTNGVPMIEIVEEWDD